MSHANENYRKDKKLKDAIYHELTIEYSNYVDSAEMLQKIYDNTNLNRVEVYILLKKAIWYRDFYSRVLNAYPEDDCYIRNKAAFLSELEVAQLREKYNFE